jgi:hypothetical protein
MSISITGPTACTGGYNVIGLDESGFYLQGNLTIEQLKELRNECNLLLKTINKEKRYASPNS